MHSFTRTTALFCSVSLLTFAGCGGPGSSSSSLTPITQDQYAAQSAVAFCKKIFACCTSDQAKANFNVTGDEPTCEKDLTKIYQGFFPDASAKLTYDGSAAACAIAGLTSADCSLFNGTSKASATSCGPLFTPLQANGAACKFAEECTSHLCVGISYDTSGKVSGAGACTAPGTSGQACPSAGTGKVSAGTTCQFGLVGKYDTGSCICGTPGNIGDACLIGSDCVSLNCDSGATKKCVAAKVAVTCSK